MRFLLALLFVAAVFGDSDPPATCSYGGQTGIAVGTKITDPGNPCKYAECKDGGVMMRYIQGCPNPCPLGYDTVKQPCCFTCVQKDVCVEDNKEYKKGQQIPNDNICYNCTCMGMGRVSCVGQSCPSQCDDGSVPVKVQGQCCGTCPAKRDVCKYNGVEYQPNTKINTGDPCLECECLPGPWTDCIQYECAPCPGKSTPVAGQCCPKCEQVAAPSPPPTGCTVDGTTYTIGQTIPVQDKCQKCNCSRNGQKQCETIRCSAAVTQCPAGSKLSNDCCPICVVSQESCIIKGHAYKINETIPTADPCYKCLCTANGQFCSNITCVACPAGTRQVPNAGTCCPDCVPNPTTQTCSVTLPNGTVVYYDPRQEMPSTVPCQFCYCAGPQRGKVCQNVTCPPAKCDAGWAPFKSAGQCCTGCQQCSIYETVTDAGCKINCPMGTEPDPTGPMGSGLYPNRYCRCKGVLLRYDEKGFVVCQGPVQDPCAGFVCPTGKTCALDQQSKPICQGTTAPNKCYRAGVNDCTIKWSGPLATACDFSNQLATCAKLNNCFDMARVECDHKRRNCDVAVCSNPNVVASTCQGEDYEDCESAIDRNAGECAKWTATLDCAQKHSCKDYSFSVCQYAASPEGLKVNCPAVATWCKANPQIEATHERSVHPSLTRSASLSPVVLVVVAAVAVIALVAVVVAVKSRRRSAVDYIEMEEVVPSQ